MPGDFNLEVEVVARLDKLEAGLQKMDASINKTQDKIGSMADDQKGMGKLVKTAGKAVAAFAAIEIASRAASTAGQAFLGIMDSLAGETEDAQAHFEGALNAAKQLPFGIGGAIDAISVLAMAIAGVEEDLRDLAELEEEMGRYDEIKRNAAAAHAANRRVYESAADNLAILEATSDEDAARVQIQRDLASQIEEINKRVADATKDVGTYIGGVLVMSEGLAETIRRNGQATIDLLEQEAEKRLEVIRLQEEEARQERIVLTIQETMGKLTGMKDEMRRIHLRGQEEGLALLAEEIRRRELIADLDRKIKEAREAGEESLVKQLQQNKRLLFFQLQDLENLAKKARSEDRAKKAQEEADKKAEKAAEKRAKMEEAARKTQEAFMKAKHQMETEIAEARSEAAAAAQGATATFSTAGGSFTTAISAQVSEAKILNKISGASKDLLAQIVRNTATMGGIGFA